jgi:drug/metabolite transporter (DMT)-like permease
MLYPPTFFSFSCKGSAFFSGEKNIAHLEIIALGLYLSGLRHLPATETGCLASTEPIAASISTYVFLGAVLHPIQYVAGV